MARPGRAPRARPLTPGTSPATPAPCGARSAFRTQCALVTANTRPGTFTPCPSSASTQNDRDAAANTNADSHCVTPASPQHGNRGTKNGRPAAPTRADRQRLDPSARSGRLWCNRYRRCVACEDDRGEELSYARPVSSGNRRLSGDAHHTEVERASWRSLYPKDVGATPSCVARLTPADRTRLAASRGSLVLDPSAKAQPPSAAAHPPVSGCTRRPVIDGAHTGTRCPEIVLSTNARGRSRRTRPARSGRR